MVGIDRLVGVRGLLLPCGGTLQWQHWLSVWSDVGVLLFIGRLKLGPGYQGPDL